MNRNRAIRQLHDEQYGDEDSGWVYDLEDDLTETDEAEEHGYTEEEYYNEDID